MMRHSRRYMVLPPILLLVLSVFGLALPAHAADTVQSGQGYTYSDAWKQWHTAYEDGMLKQMYGDYVDDDFLKALDDPEYLKECKEHPEARIAPKDMPIEEAISKRYTTFYNSEVNSGSVDAMLHPDSYKIPATDYIDGTFDAMNKAAKSQHYYVQAPTRGERMMNVGKFTESGRIGMTTTQIEQAEQAGMSFEQVISGAQNAQGAKAAEEAIEESSKKTAQKLMEKSMAKAEAKATAKAIAKTALKPLAFGLKGFSAIQDLILAEQGGVLVGNQIVRVAKIDQSEECRAIQNDVARLALGISSKCSQFEVSDEQMQTMLQLQMLNTMKNPTCIKYAYTREHDVVNTMCPNGFGYIKYDGKSAPAVSFSSSIKYRSTNASYPNYFGFNSKNTPGLIYYIDSPNNWGPDFWTYSEPTFTIPEGSRPGPISGYKNKVFDFTDLGGFAGFFLLKNGNPNAYSAYYRLVGFAHADGSDAKDFDFGIHSVMEQPNICTQVTMEDGTQHVECGGQIIKTDDGQNQIQPPDVYVGGDDNSDHSVTNNNIKEVKVIDVHPDGSITDLGGGKVSAGEEGYLDLWNVPANVSCFDGGEACADWSTQVKTITGEELSSKNKHTTSTDPKLQYSCRWYEQDKKTFKELPIGECAVYKDTFVQKNQATRTPYTDPKTGEMPENPVIPKTAVYPKFDFSSCVTQNVSLNPVSWVFVPVSCALKWAFKPDPVVMTTATTNIKVKTGAIATPLQTSFEQHYRIFGNQAADCKGPEFSLAFKDVQIINPSYPMSVCKGSGLEFLPVFSRAAFTALYGYACLLVIRKWFFGITGFNPETGEKDGKK